MADKVGKVVDSSGTIHQRGFDGQYRPKPGVGGPDRDLDVFGKPNVKRDVFGKPEPVRNSWGYRETSSSGRPLYQGSGGSSTSSTDWDGIFGFIFWVIANSIYGLYKLIRWIVREIQTSNETRSEEVDGIVEVDEFADDPSLPLLVSKTNSEGFDTISEALKYVTAGGKIVVEAGVYKESIVLDRQIEIEAVAGPGETIIESVGAPCIIMRAAQASIKGFTIRHLGRTTDKAEAGVHVPQGDFTLENCRISSGAAGPGSAGIYVRGAETRLQLSRCIIRDCGCNGISFGDKSKGVVEACIISGCSWACVAISGGSDPVFRRCKIHNGKQAGLFVYSNGRGTVEDCDIYGNALAGVEIKEGGAPLLRRCRLYEGKQSGIYVHTNGSGTIEDCDVYANEKSGVIISEAGSPTIRRCKMRDCKGSGLLVHTNGRGVAEDCEMSGNGVAGVEVKGGGDPLVQRCKIHDGRQGGIWVHTAGGGTFEECDVWGNALAGVEVRDNGDPVMRACRIHDGLQSGIRFHTNGKGTVERCDISSNRFAGISVDDAAAWIRGCKINKNGTYAVHVGATGTVLVELCDLRGNGKGAWSTESGSKVQRAQNTE